MSRHSRRKNDHNKVKEAWTLKSSLDISKENNEPLILNTLAWYSELDTDTQKLLEDYIKYIDSKGKHIDSKLVEQWISNHMKVKKTREYNFYFKWLRSIPYPDDIRFTQADRDRLLDIEKDITKSERTINKGKTDWEIEKAIQEKQILENEMEEIKKRGALNREMEALKTESKDSDYIDFFFADWRVQKFVLVDQEPDIDLKTSPMYVMHRDAASSWKEILSWWYLQRRKSSKIIAIFGKSSDYGYNKQYNPTIIKILEKLFPWYEIRFWYPEYEAEAVDKNWKHFFLWPFIKYINCYNYIEIFYKIFIKFL